MFDQTTVSKEQKQEFRDNPEKYKAYRKEIESELNHRFKFVGTPPIPCPDSR